MLTLVKKKEVSQQSQQMTTFLLWMNLRKSVTSPSQSSKTSQLLLVDKAAHVGTRFTSSVAGETKPYFGKVYGVHCIMASVVHKLLRVAFGAPCAFYRLIQAGETNF
mmetsp:Transcript_17119/g.33524  ORF Transcript_17119/g.33524 Transcript_17119/m.33524 type:complete len:107 (-) Transcript_17119:509-829(-)